MFRRAHDERHALFIPYVTAGYPERSDTVPILLAMEAGGADVIEIGVPFTDPLADGSTVQHANQVAIEHGTSMRDCLTIVREARAQGLKAPLLFMGYYNPVLAYGEERLAIDAQQAGLDGFIIVDLPPEEAGVFVAACKAHDLSFVPLVAPTTSDARIAKLAAVADAFLYCVSVMGTTGRNNIVAEHLPAFLDRIRAQTNLPLAVGFGISKREHVVSVGKVADAAVIGSAIIATIDASAAQDRARSVREFVEDVTGR